MKLKNEQQQSWLSLAFVWAGAMISVPGLIIGGTLVAGMPLWEALLTRSEERRVGKECRL